MQGIKTQHRIFLSYFCTPFIVPCISSAAYITDISSVVELIICIYVCIKLFDLQCSIYSLYILINNQNIRNLRDEHAIIYTICNLLILLIQAFYKRSRAEVAVDHPRQFNVSFFSISILNTFFLILIFFSVIATESLY